MFHMIYKKYNIDLVPHNNIITINNDDARTKFLLCLNNFINLRFDFVLIYIYFLEKLREKQKWVRSGVT